MSRSNNEKPPLLLRFFGKDSAAPTSERWRDLEDQIRASGYEVLGENEIARCQAGLWIDNDPSSRTALIPKTRKILFQGEPRSVHPSQYSSKVTEQFGLVLSENINAKSDPGKIFWASGQFSETDICALESEPDTTRIRYGSGLINSNKNSFVAGNLYGLRREVIKRLSALDIPFFFAGRDWARGSLYSLTRDLKELIIAARSGLKAGEMAPSFSISRVGKNAYVGEQESSRKFLGTLELAIVIENESNYYSEKLTDALYARCHVVYVGPDLEGLSNLRNVTLCPPDVDEIVAKVTSLLEVNNCNLNYTEDERLILRGLTYRAANRKLVEILDDFLLPPFSDSCYW